MSYINDITTALVTVLTVACDGPSKKFAGYEANQAFWAEEAAHCLAVIDGYPARFERMRIASKRHPGSSEYPSNRIQTPSTFPSELTAAREQVLSIMTCFLTRCIKERSGDLRPIQQSFGLLGLPSPK